MTEGPPSPSPRQHWPWLAFAFAAAWAILVRAPLVLNAPSHLDSDLAVDGLTLLDTARGHPRWHYPGTPFMGIGPVFFSLPQALAFGVRPETLVSGGTVAQLGLMLAAFLLAWRAYGPGVAAWSLPPLTFASTGLVWLSGRITGGHLTAAVGHAGAFALLVPCLESGKWRQWIMLGLWSGVMLYLDSMMALTVVGLVAAIVIRAFPSGGRGNLPPYQGGIEVGVRTARPDPGLGIHPPQPPLRKGGSDWLGETLAVGPAVPAETRPGADGLARSWRQTMAGMALGALAFGVGVAPREIGSRLEPYNAYRDQFEFDVTPALLASHANTLLTECLPRLVAGHQLPGLASDPDPSTLNGPGTSRPRNEVTPLSVATTAVSLLAFTGSTLAIIVACVRAPTRAGRAVAFGLIVSSLATLAGFVANRNIFNSDNYRYLVGLTVPYALGFGLAMRHLAKKRRLAWVFALAFAGLMTADLGRWYARFGWVDARGRPVTKPADDPTLAWLDAHPDITWLDGGYWDVYRLAFLTGGRVRGRPFPVYPDRFPEWDAPAESGRATVVRPSPEGRIFAERALAGGKTVVHKARGVSILVGP